MLKQAPVFLSSCPRSNVTACAPLQVCDIHTHTHVEAILLLAGGGAVEAALSIYLENFATTLGSREQLAIAEFADALLVIPKTLAVNAAQVGPWQPQRKACVLASAAGPLASSMPALLWLLVNRWPSCTLPCN